MKWLLSTSTLSKIYEWRKPFYLFSLFICNRKQGKPLRALKRAIHSAGWVFNSHWMCCKFQNSILMWNSDRTFGQSSMAVSIFSKLSCSKIVEGVSKPMLWNFHFPFHHWMLPTKALKSSRNDVISFPH